MLVKVPNNIIRDPAISSGAFAVYIVLVYLRNTPDLNYKNVLQYLSFLTVRNLKHYLNELYIYGLVEEYTDSFKKNKSISLIYETPEVDFTQISFEMLIDKLPVIKAQGLRLLFYYESFTNRKLGKNYSYPTIDLITKHTGLSDKTISKYNKILVKENLLTVNDEGIFFYKKNYFFTNL